MQPDLRWKVLEGKTWWSKERRELAFTNVKERDFSDACDRRYRSVFGPSVPHDGAILANSPNNLTLGLKARMTSLRFNKEERKDDAPGTRDQKYRDAQKKYIEQHEDQLAKLALRYSSYFSPFDYLNDLEMEVNKPHDKKALRMEMFELICLGYINIYDPTWLRSNERKNGYVTYKAKCDEIAKSDTAKAIRLIGDLGVLASLLGIGVTAQLKKAQAGEVVIVNDVEIITVAKPSPAILIECFEKLRNPSGRGTFVLFSDDSSYSIRTEGRVAMFNVDIKTCDASHSPAIFSLYKKMFPLQHQQVVGKLIDQCKAPIVVQNPHREKRHERVVLQYPEPRLWSGSTITTTINNLANLLIGISLAEEQPSTPETILSCVSKTGYVVSVDECATFHQLQFLKHSPVIDTKGQLRALLNIGVLLRATGTCKGDLPGNGSFRERAEAFQKGLYQGMYPLADFPLIHNLKRTVARAGELDAKFLRKHLPYHSQEKVGESFSVSGREVFARYELTPSEILEVEEVFGNSGYGAHCNFEGLSKILLLDYGLRCTQ